MLFEFFKRHYRLFIFLFIICFFGYLLLLSQYSFFQKSKLIKRKKALLSEIDSNLKVQDSLMKRINALKFDTNEIEKVARMLYGYVKEGELIYVPKKKNTGK